MHRIRTNGNVNIIGKRWGLTESIDISNGPISRRRSASLGVDDAHTASSPSRSLICLELEQLTIQGFLSGLLKGDAVVVPDDPQGNPNAEAININVDESDEYDDQTHTSIDNAEDVINSMRTNLIDEVGKR